MKKANVLETEASALYVDTNSFVLASLHREWGEYIISHVDFLKNVDFLELRKKNWQQYASLPKYDMQQHVLFL